MPSGESVNNMGLGGHSRSKIQHKMSTEKQLLSSLGVPSELGKEQFWCDIGQNLNRAPERLMEA
jgi:hypothetical protein